MSTLVLLASLLQSEQVTGARANKNLHHVSIYSKLYALRLFRSSTVPKKPLYAFLPSPQPRSTELVLPLSAVPQVRAQPQGQPLPRSLSRSQPRDLISPQRIASLRSSTMTQGEDASSVFPNPRRKRPGTFSKSSGHRCEVTSPK